MGPATAPREADTRHPRTANLTVAVLPTVGPAVKITVHNMVAMGVVLRTTIRYVTNELRRPSRSALLPFERVVMVIFHVENGMRSDS